MKRKIGIIIATVLAVTMAVAMVGCGKKEMKVKKDKTGSALKGEFSATIDETVIIDEAGVKITAKELTYTDYSADLEILIENNSDRELSFHTCTLANMTNSINGYMVDDGVLWEDVAVGMSATETISFAIDNLLVYGIKDIADITLGISILDENLDHYLPLTQKTIKTSIADKYDYEKDTFMEAIDSEVYTKLVGAAIDSSTKEELFDKQGIKSLCTYAVTNSEGNQGLLFEIINNSGKNQYVSINDVQLNGILVYSGTWDNQFINDGKRAIMYIDTNLIMDNDMKTQYGIDAFSQITFTLGIHDIDYRQIGDAKVELEFGDAKKMDQSGEVVYQANDVKLIFKGVSIDKNDYLNIMLLAQNTGSKDLLFYSADDIYINKKKAGNLFVSEKMAVGSNSMVNVKLAQYEYEDVVKDIKDVKDVSFKIEIRDENYNEIDTPTLEIKVK